MTTEEKAKKIVYRLVEDMRDICGFDNVWNQIKESDQEEIRITWERIVLRELTT